MGEGAGAKHAFAVFPAALKVAWGDGFREGPLQSLNPGHPLANERAADFSCARGNYSPLSAILIYVKGRIDDAEQTRGHDCFYVTSSCRASLKA